MKRIKNKNQYTQKLHPKITLDGKFCYDPKYLTDIHQDWDMVFIEKTYMEFDLSGRFFRMVYWNDFLRNVNLFVIGHQKHLYTPPKEAWYKLLIDRCQGIKCEPNQQ